MTVKELIKNLEKEPPDNEVVFSASINIDTQIKVFDDVYKTITHEFDDWLDLVKIHGITQTYHDRDKKTHVEELTAFELKY